MNERTNMQYLMQRAGLLASSLALVLLAGCTSGDPSITLSTLASDLGRQLATWWLL